MVHTFRNMERRYNNDEFGLMVYVCSMCRIRTQYGRDAHCRLACCRGSYRRGHRQGRGVQRQLGETSFLFVLKILKRHTQPIDERWHVSRKKFLSFLSPFLISFSMLSSCSSIPVSYPRSLCHSLLLLHSMAPSWLYYQRDAVMVFG